MERNRLAQYVLTASLAFVFLWFGVDKFVHAYLWMGFLPAWMDGLLNMEKNAWISIVGAGEIALGVLLLVPVRRIRQAAAALIVLHLAGILVQVGWNDVGVRDIGLLLSAMALFLLL